MTDAELMHKLAAALQIEVNACEQGQGNPNSPHHDHCRYLIEEAQRRGRE